MGKWTKPDLSYLGNDLSNNSIKSISWQLTNIIPKKLYTKKIKKSWPFFWPLERFNQTHLLAVHQHPHWEASCQNREKIIRESVFWENCRQSKKSAKFDLSDLYKWPLGWFNQITVHWYLPKEASCQTSKNVIRPFLRNQCFKWKVDDRRWQTTDDGQLGIRKSTLRSGWRS